MTRSGTTNAPVDLARYRTSSGERILRGQRVLGVVHITDIPAGGHGRRYLVERDLTSKTELDAIVQDYLKQATAWDAVPAVRCFLTSESER